MNNLDIEDKVINFVDASVLPPLTPITLCYRHKESREWFLVNWDEDDDSEWVPTYTIDEILDILPEKSTKGNLMFLYKSNGFWNVGYYGETKIIREKLLDALHKLLLWAYDAQQIDSKYIKDRITICD